MSHPDPLFDNENSYDDDYVEPMDFGDLLSHNQKHLDESYDDASYDEYDEHMENADLDFDQSDY